MTGTVLTADRIVAGYEPGTSIVDGASLEARAGEIVAVLGPNGAGKSTLVKAIAGLVPLTAGRIVVDGVDVTLQPAHRRAAGGLAYVPQIDNVFATLSVEDNLALAAPGARAARRQAIAAALDLFPELWRTRAREAGRLSGGQRQMLAVARALVVPPRVLMLDEPSAGLSPKVVGELFARLRAIGASGIAILLVEQNVRAALDIADRALVLVQGRNHLEGPAAVLAADPALASLYVGGRAGRAA